MVCFIYLFQIVYILKHLKIPILLKSILGGTVSVVNLHCQYTVPIKPGLLVSKVTLIYNLPIIYSLCFCNMIYTNYPVQFVLETNREHCHILYLCVFRTNHIKHCVLMSLANESRKCLLCSLKSLIWLEMTGLSKTHCLQQY